MFYKFITSIVSLSLIMASFYFFLISHPLILSIIILCTSFLIYISLSQLLSSWVGMALMLIFLGGMMIIFLYMTSLSSNEKFFLKKKTSFLFFLVLCFSTNFLGVSKSVYFFENLKELYFFEKFLILMLIISYLLFSLILMVKTSESFKGSLKKNF